MAEQNELPSKWKAVDEFAAFHPHASHVDPDYRDGWNHCHAAATARIAELEQQVRELKADAERHKNAADIFAAALQLVREYPDFDNGGTLAEVMDAALRLEIHPALQFLVDVRATYRIATTQTEAPNA